MGLSTCSPFPLHIEHLEKRNKVTSKVKVMNHLGKVQLRIDVSEKISKLGLAVTQDTLIAG